VLYSLWDRGGRGAARLCAGPTLLVVSDIEAARRELVERGVGVGEVEDLGGVLYAPFSDPDGNGWTLQQLPY